MKHSAMVLSLLILAAPNALATTINKTQIETTQILKNGADQPEEKDDRFNRPAIDDAKLRQLVTQETAKINALMRSSTYAVVSGTKEGKPDIHVIAQNASASQPLADVIRVDADWEAEKRKRELEERMQVERLRKGEITPKEMEQQTLRSIFPVKTTMKPTRLPSREVKLSPIVKNNVMQPMAVIGTDAYSLEWFKANVQTLTKLNAGIIVTEVNSLTDLQALQSLAPELNFNPVDASVFLDAIGVSVYPILITAEGAFQ